MSLKQSNTAVLLFTRTSSSEARAKMFTSANARANEHIAETLIARSYQVAKSTGFDVHVINEQKQVGSTFGERITNAVQDIFECGYKYVLTIGNDTPGITKSHLLNAHNNLLDNELVIGPSRDGGVYLIGISRDHFDAKSFKALAWESASLQKSFTDYVCELNVGLHLLEVLHDVDNIRDLRYIIHVLRQKKYTRVLAQSLLNLTTASNHLPIQQVNGIPLSALMTLHGLRAPPSV